MKKVMIWLFASMFVLSSVGFSVAQEVGNTAVIKIAADKDEEATVSAAVVVEEELVKPKEDLTEPKAAKSRLERVLDSKEVKGLRITNFLQVAIRRAVENGVPVNTIVLMMLFPLVAAIIAAARHIVGLRGFGIFTPAVISVAFLATGVVVGMILFVGILVVATVARVLIRKLRMPSLPRMALLIWSVSMGVLMLMLFSPWLRLEGLVQISIFPILLLVLLMETFIEVQVTTTLRNALTMTLQTFVLALVAFLVMSTQALQEWVLLNPEISVLVIAALDILIGRYDGLRLMERWRFRELSQN